MSEASSIYACAMQEVESIDRWEHGCNLPQHEKDRILISICYKELARRMHVELIPYDKAYLDILGLSAVPGASPELPKSIEEYRSHIEKKWMGVWDQIINKRF